jgi:hypothetical protein
VRKIMMVAAALALAGCGGGGGGSAPATSPVQVATPAPPSSAYPSSAKLTIIVPVGPQQPSSSQRYPQYVSPNSAKLDVVINTVNGSSTLASWVPRDTSFALDKTAGGNCVDNTTYLTCTVTVPAPPGSVSYNFTVVDSSKNPLSAAYNVIQTITEGSGNTLTVTLQGVVDAVTVSGTGLVANTSSNNALTLGVSDKSGAPIRNDFPANYFNPITLTDNDVSGSTQLCKGVVCGSTATVNSPADTITLKYSGQGENGFTITAAAGAFSNNAFNSSNVNNLTPAGGLGTITTTVQDITFPSGTTIATTANGAALTDPNYNQQTMFFPTNSGSQQVTGAELGWTNAPYNQQFAITLDSSGPYNCTGEATASASPATTFTITVTNGAAPGFCRAKLTETGVPGTPLTGHPPSTAGSGMGPTKDGVFWITITTNTVNLNDKHRQTH